LIIGASMEYIEMQRLGHDQRVTLSGNNPANVGASLMTIGYMLSFSRIFRLFLLFRSFGPVILSIIRVLKDILKVLALFMITYGSFSIGTWSMLRNFSKGYNTTYDIGEEKMKTVGGVLDALFWRVLDPGEPEMAQVIKRRNSTNPDDFVISHEFSHLLGLGIWAAYQLIVTVILLNILIALMNNTFSKISENADIEWKYSKSYYLMGFLTPKAALPPPFNFFYYFARWVWLVRNSCHNEMHNISNEGKKRKYFNLVDRLVKSKMHFDFEDSVEDDFDDLRLDIKNMIDSKHHETMEKINVLTKKVKDLEARLGQVSNN